MYITLYNVSSKITTKKTTYLTLCPLPPLPCTSSSPDKNIATERLMARRKSLCSSSGAFRGRVRVNRCWLGQPLLVGISRSWTAQTKTIRKLLFFCYVFIERNETKMAHIVGYALCPIITVAERKSCMA